MGGETTHMSSGDSVKIMFYAPAKMGRFIWQPCKEIGTFSITVGINATDLFLPGDYVGTSLYLSLLVLRFSITYVLFC